MQEFIKESVRDENYVPQFENNGHTAPYNDGGLVRALYNETYEDDIQKGYCYSVNLVDFVRGIEPYAGCNNDMPGMYDYDNGASRRALNNAINDIQCYLYEMERYEKYGIGNKPVIPKITIYRAVPPRSEDNDRIGDGEWISLSKNYAKMHGDGYVRNYHIQEAKVPANHIYWDGQHFCEFGYDSRTIDMTQELNLEVCNIEKVYDIGKNDAIYEGVMEVNGTEVNFKVEAYHKSDYYRVMLDRKSSYYPLLNARKDEIDNVVKDAIKECFQEHKKEKNNNIER